MQKQIFTVVAGDRRQTKIKQAVAGFVAKAEKPFSAQELTSHLNSLGLHPNKTTIYRQLDSWIENKLLQTVNLNDGVVRYEAISKSCHHHIVCHNCGYVEHIELGKELQKLQNKLSISTGFAIDEHMLEFFGLCPKCQVK